MSRRRRHPGVPATKRCGKRRYPSRKLAEQVRGRANHRNDESLRVYGCPRCGGFHLTHRKGAPVYE